MPFKYEIYHMKNACQMKSYCDTVIPSIPEVSEEMDTEQQDKNSRKSPGILNDNNEEQAQAMIREYSAHEICINSFESSRVSSATSRGGSTALIIPQVVYTPPTIIVKKASSGALRQHFIEKENEEKAVGQMCFLAPPSPFLGKGILRNKIPMSRPGSARSCQSVRLDDPFSNLRRTRHIFIRHHNKSIKSALYATNTFQVINSHGDCILLAKENSSVLKSFCLCRGARTFSLHVMNTKHKNLLHIQGRPGCFASVSVRNANNDLIGTIRQNNEMCTTKYSVYNSDNVEILKIIGMEGANCCCAWASCEDVDFHICLPDGVTPIGRISREWDYSFEDICGALVSLKVDVKTKSLILAGVFLIDFSFYEGREDGCWFSRCFLTLLLFVLFTGLLWIIVDK